MRPDRSLLARIALGGLLLSGCSTFAIYRHPVTGEVMECETNPGPGSPGVGDIRGRSPYADCKTMLEEQGYERVGTRHGDQQDPISGRPQPAKTR